MILKLNLYVETPAPQKEADKVKLILEKTLLLAVKEVEELKDKSLKEPNNDDYIAKTSYFRMFAQSLRTHQVKGLNQDEVLERMRTSK